MQEKKAVTLQYSADLPYPEVQSSTNNPSYGAAMLDNLGGQNSEMSTISYYIYSNLVSEEWKEISDTFHHISIVEMHHLKIFGQLATQCKQNPRMWTRGKNRHVYWSPAYIQYPTTLETLLLQSIQGETAARNKYLRQKEWIDDCNIQENLERIALDEQLHIEILTDLYQKYCK